MRKPYGIAALAAAALLLAVAPVRGLSWIVPGVANAAGLNGARFSSALTIVNSGAADRTVTLSLVPGFGTPGVPDRAYVVAAGATLALENVLAAAWSIEGTGALRVSADGPVALFARVANLAGVVSIPENPPPAFGSALPVVDDASLLSAGQTGHSAWLAQSATSTSGERTNVAVAFPDQAGGAATLTIYNEQGTAAGSLSLDAAQPAFLQKSLGAFGAGAATAARVAVAVTRGRACAYTGAIDNVTGDMTIFPADPAPAGPTAAVTSGAAQVPGVNGAFWQTEVHLFNPSGALVSGEATLLGAPAAATLFVSVLPGQTAMIPSLLTSGFHLSDPAVGSVVWSANGPLVIQTRTSSAAGAAFQKGSVGAAQSAIPLQAFQRAGDAPVDLADLAAGPFARTNLLIAAGPAGSTHTLEARDSEGRVLGTARQILKPLGFAEFALANLFALPSGAGRFRVRLSVESGSVNVQAAVVDAITNDPVFLETFPRPAVRSSTPPLPAGTWGSPDGGEGLLADATTIVVDRWCRKGTFPQPARLDAQGNFAVVGEYVLNIGPAAGFTAILSGKTDGRIVTTAIFRLSDGVSLDTPTTYVLGTPYTISPGPCPIEY